MLNIKKNDTITIAKGFGIILVVIGHYLPNESPYYWKLINHFIYGFHMPLFLILSGFLYRKDCDYGKINSKFIMKKFKRLIIPFISIALIAYAVKYFAGSFFYLKHPVTQNSLLLIFITPKGTYFPLLWFMYSLFIIFLLFPILNIVLKEKFLIFILSVLLMQFKWTQYFYLNYVLKSLPFFCFGALFLAKINFDRIDRKNIVPIFVIGFLTSLVNFYLLEFIVKDKIIANILKVIFGITASLVLIFIASLVRNWKGYRFFFISGYYSMSIYLLHTIFMSSIRILNYQILKLQLFLFPAILAIIIGVIVPVLLEQYFLRNNKFTKKYILGLT